MDFEYGCSTVNKFAFLDENEVEDPSDLLAQVKIANEAAAKTTKDTKKTDTKGKKTDQKKSTKDTKKPLQSSDNAVKKTGDKQDGKKGERRDNNKPSGDLAKENRGPRRQDGDRPPRRSGEGFRPRPPRQFDSEGNAVEHAEGENFRGGYRGPRGQGGYRGNRGPRRDGDNEGEGRKFDRHSGSEKTGIKAVDKKDGAGKGNWGTATDEVVIEETLGEAPAEGETKDWAERVDENEEKKEEVPEEDTLFMTLEEYRALKSQINKRNDFNIRRPGEGEDLTKWGKTYVLPKKVDDEDEEDEDDDEEDEDGEDEPEDLQKKELIKSMQSAFKFESTNQSDRGGRGDRGRGGPRRNFRKEGGEATAPATATEAAPTEERRQQGGRGGQQGGRAGQRSGRGNTGRGPQKSAPKFDDEKDFPTLGK